MKGLVAIAALGFVGFSAFRLMRRPPKRCRECGRAMNNGDCYHCWGSSQ